MRNNRVAIVLSALALGVSLLALGVAFTRDTTVAPTADPTVTSSGSPTTAPATLDPAETSTAPVDPPTTDDNSLPTPSDTGGVDPQAEYTLAYEDKQQRIPVGAYDDLDEPRVQPASGTSDLYYGGNKQFQSNIARAVVPSANATAQDCADAIQNAPLTDQIAAATGLTLCLQTDAGAASAAGISQKMVRLTVKSVDKDDTVTVRLTAWNVPS